MGKQIKVLDMVRNLIQVSGFTPDEIPIQVIGTRHWEKLYVESARRDETMEPSGMDQILRVQSIWVPEPVVLEQ